MSKFQIDITNIDIYTLEILLKPIPKDKLYIGNNFDGLVNFKLFYDTFNNKNNELISMFEEIIQVNSLDDNSSEYNVVMDCINLLTYKPFDTLTIFLKMIVIYTKYMDSELYFRIPSDYWNIIGSRIYPWFAVESEYTTNFPNIIKTDY